MADRRTVAAKGARELVTMQSLAQGRQPRERYQQVSRFVRLENERARLERELAMWEARRAAVQERLGQIYQQIDAMRSLLLEERPTRLAGHRMLRGQKASVRSDRDAPLTAPKRNMSIDY